MTAFRLAYKALALGLVSYALVAGLGLRLPWVPLLDQSARAVFYHIPLWIAMYGLMTVGVVNSILYLRKPSDLRDAWARNSLQMAGVFGVLGLVTGMLWARVTWNAALPDTDPAAWWPKDPKNNLVAIALLVLLAYQVLRNSVELPVKKARLAAVYSIFAFVAVLTLTYVVPRLQQSMHPGSDQAGGTDTQFAPEYRLILYPAFLGFFLLALWFTELRVRLQQLEAPNLPPPPSAPR